MQLHISRLMLIGINVDILKNVCNASHHFCMDPLSFQNDFGHSRKKLFLL